MQHILTEKKNHTFVIMLNRPQALNALNAALLDELDTAIKTFEQDDELKGAVIIGAGDKAFAAGADIQELTRLSEDEALGLSLKGQAIFSSIEHCSKPIIAAVNGFALGGGCELAMACHLRIAAEHARFGQPEVKLGLIPGYGGTQRLVRYIGRAKATELLITGEMIDAKEAYRLGLVNEVTPKGALADKCMEILRKSYEQSPLAIRLLLEAVAAGVDGEDGYYKEAVNFSKAIASQDGREGTRAFLEKRKARFMGK
ncbi:MAG: enoyl-CoA hydratase [Bacteroidetes bacterium]|nr:MAG: enoyl-CoA hydratase [Bacteroidota bacterium]